LQGAHAAEFLLLGMLSGLLGALGATAIGWALADRVFSIPFSGNALVFVYGIAGGAFAVLIAGWLGTRETVREPPLAVLRELG
jgi:putative ABC transport system permease protein